MAKTYLQKTAEMCECGHAKRLHKGGASYCEIILAGQERTFESCTCAAFHEAAPWNLDRW